jgi:hypothetical protein
MEAETICGLLRTEGIACDHRQTDMGAGAGDAVGDSGPRGILVARDDLESARQLVSTPRSVAIGADRSPPLWQYLVGVRQADARIADAKEREPGDRQPFLLEIDHSLGVNNGVHDAVHGPLWPVRFR